MKKLLSIGLISILSLALFTGCGEKAANETSKEAEGYKDGVYKVEYKDFDEHGWKDYVEVEVKDGKIATVDFDSKSAEGKLKSEDEGYKSAMEPQAGTYPEKYMSELEQKLVDKQSVADVDAVTGATTSTNSFTYLASIAVDEMAKSGDAEPRTVEPQK